MNYCCQQRVAIAGELVNPRSLLLRNFVLNGQESASNPLLYIHANHYRQAEKTTVRRLMAVIQANFAEKVSFTENMMYICRIICGE